MSKSTFGSQKTPSSPTPRFLIHEPVISALDAEHVITFAEERQRKPLSESEKTEIKNEFAANKALIELADLHNRFIDIKNNFNLLMGLNDRQSEEIQRLISNVREFKALRRKGDITIQDLKNIVADEHELIPLNQTIEWWTVNSGTLKKLEFWEDIAEMIKNDCTRNQDSDSDLKNKLHNLSDIKNEWISQQIFCGCSSSRLLDFYTSFICKMEGWLVESLTVNDYRHKKRPAAITDYIKHILYEVRELKKVALLSMHSRLVCAEYYQDIKADDLLTYTCDQLFEKCNINLLHNGVRPKPRRSLTPQLITEYVKTISDYCKDNPAEKNLLQNLDRLRMQTLPDTWRQTAEDGNSLKKLLQYPVIVFAGHAIPSLIMEAYKESNLASILLNSDWLNDKGFVLNKLKSLWKRARLEQQKIPGKATDPLHNALTKIFAEQDKIYKSLLDQLSLKITIEIQNQINLLNDSIFSNKNIDHEIILTTLKQIKNAGCYARKFMDLNYCSYTDIILALANKIKIRVATNQDITPYHINNIISVIKLICPEKRNEEFAPLKAALAKLPESAQKINENNESGFLHLLVNIIESSMLSRERLQTALYRHHHIAAIYGETWDDEFDNPGKIADDQKYMLTISGYIKNVLLRIIEISPYIDFTNFDKNEMCALLDDLENDMAGKTSSSSLDKQLIPEIRTRLQRAIRFKLNDLFLLKSYLYSSNSQLINIEKLKSLLNRIENFFTDIESKKTLLELISTAVQSLVKNYCLNVIESNSRFDISYINELNAVAGEDILQGIHDDRDLKKTLVTYISTYDGTQNNLSWLLTHLLPAAETEKTGDLLLNYAKKRLDFIKFSRSASPDDYHFFAAYSGIPAIAELIDDTRGALRNFLLSSMNNAVSPWSLDTAILAELFCDDAAIFQYRLKRVIELANRADPRLDNLTMKAQFREFLSTINPHKSIHGRIIDPAIKAAGDQTLLHYLDNVIATQPWTILLEMIVAKCGTDNQLQRLHLMHTMHCIDQHIDLGKEWIGMQILAGSTEPAEENSPNDDDAIKHFFNHFYGDEGCKKLIVRLESALQELFRINNDLNAKEISNEEYKRLISLIASIKPLKTFFRIYGTSKPAKSTFASLDEIEKKIHLHFNLHTVLKRQTSLLKISSDNPELHNLILSIIEAITHIESRQMLTNQNINQYLSFMDKEILSRIDAMLLQPTNLDYKTLSTLSNLMLYLASDNVKLLLISMNKQQILQNPYWLVLINHLEERGKISHLESLQKDPHYDALREADFQHILMFANHLTSIKRQAHRLIQQSILSEAGIHEHKTDQMTTLEFLCNPKIRDRQLLKLWLCCAEKLNTNNLHPQSKTQFILFLIRFLTYISEAILSRARDDKSLLNDYIDLFSHIYDARAAIARLYNNDDQVSSPTRYPSIWTKMNECDNISQPLSAIINKSLSLQLLQKIETYALKKISRNKLNAFRAYCNDPHFGNSEQTVAPDLHSIKNSLMIKRDDDAAKIARLIKICTVLSTSAQTGKMTDNISACLINAIIEAEKDPVLSKSRHYKALLVELKSLADKYFSPDNDRRYLFTSAKKHGFLHHLH
jgi:hypothetical protein